MSEENIEECEHSYKWIDDSFDHQFGTAVYGHWECENCGDENPDSPPDEVEKEVIEQEYNSDDRIIFMEDRELT